MKIINEEYLKKAKLLTEDEADSLLCRMLGRFERKLEEEKLSRLEALALQLELEDEQLAEWRMKRATIKEQKLTKFARQSFLTNPLDE